ncbi:TIR domain-containing protein [Agrobacterium deltaense]
MKAFLSHSSNDKHYVDKVAKLLRPGTYELDSLTFEKGEMNVSEIISALNRVDLFCLFLSESSALSKYVEFEQRLAIELVGAGKIKNFLTLCLDEASFSTLANDAKFFNAIRRPVPPETAAHLITGKLISAQQTKFESGHPFIGRDQEMKDLENQILDFSKPRTKALFLSGNEGVGRKTTAQQFYARHFPHVVKSYAEFDIEAYAGFDEIYRQVLAAIHPSLRMKEFIAHLETFSQQTDKEKARTIAKEINDLAADNVVVFAKDAGGLLHESGALSEEMNRVVDNLVDHPHPPLVIISPRMSARHLRRSPQDVAYLAMPTLNREDATKLISWALRSINAKPRPEQLDELMEIADFHPFNVYEIKDRINAVGVDSFLANTSSFQAWKHKQTSGYLREIHLSDHQIKILAVLLLAPELDFRSLVRALEIDSNDASTSIQGLVEAHILRFSEDRFSLSPPLRVAVERDPRVRLNHNEQLQIMRRLADEFTVALNDDAVPVALVDAVVLAALESRETISVVASALLLPSHRVWLAQRHYDAANWKESLRLALDAVKDRSRLSKQGFSAACQLLCLSASRLDRDDLFQEGITKLQSVATDTWHRSSIAFLKGFHARISGRLFDAENYFREAYKLNDNDRSTLRELASLCLITGKPEEAEKFARRAYEKARRNPYTIDSLISALVKTLGPRCVQDVEVEELLSRLEILDDEEQKSFSYTRRAEIEYLYGEVSRAYGFIREAMRRTPHLFEPKLFNAKILLKSGNKPKAKDEIENLLRMTARHGHSENKAHRREVLILKAEYFVEIGQFKEARDIFDDGLCFTDSDRVRERKKIDQAESYVSR